MPISALTGKVFLVKDDTINVTIKKQVFDVFELERELIRGETHLDSVYEGVNQYLEEINAGTILYTIVLVMVISLGLSRKRVGSVSSNRVPIKGTR